MEEEKALLSRHLGCFSQDRKVLRNLLLVLQHG